MKLEKIFHLKENKTDVRTEVIAGVTTFMTMAYILAVNPNILEASGMDRGAVFTLSLIHIFHFICQSFHIIIHTFCIHQFKKVLIDSCVFLINLASGSIPDHCCFFMSQQKSCQLVSRIAGGSDNSCFYHNKFSSFVHTASSFYVCVCRFCQDDKIIHLLCIICNNYFSQYILFFQSLYI